MSTKQKPAETHLLFVYGTLMEGYGNYAYYLAHNVVEKIGRGVTKGKFAMVVPSFPIVLREPKIYPIHGELFRVSDLSECDRLEGHPRWYQRQVVPVVIEGKIYDAWMYSQAGNAEGLPIFRCGDWRTHAIAKTTHTA